MKHTHSHHSEAVKLSTKLLTSKLIISITSSTKTNVVAHRSLRTFKDFVDFVDNFGNETGFKDFINSFDHFVDNFVVVDNSIGEVIDEGIDTKSNCVYVSLTKLTTKR